MLQWIVPRLLLASLVALALSLALRDRLPERSMIRAQLLDEPQQSAVTDKPFQARVGDVQYTVQPLFRYRIGGLVVSRHDTSAWWDLVHRDWRDQLNVVDLCLVWGNNLRNDAYQAIRFWNETFTCNAGTKSDQVWRQFDQDSLSNNHLLSNDARLTRLLRSVRPGDQVLVDGYLAEYSHHHERDFFRGTSIVRTDRGNGACETLYVTGAEVLRPANPLWRLLYPIGWIGLVLALVGWCCLPFQRRQG